LALTPLTSATCTGALLLLLLPSPKGLGMNTINLYYLHK
jgi:hypothetical protein